MAKRSTKKAVRPYPVRRKTLLTTLKSDGVDFFLVGGVENVRYLSGFRGEDSMLLYMDGEFVLLTDSRFAIQAGKDCSDLRVHIRAGSMADAIVELLGGKIAFKGVLCVEQGTLSLGQFEQLAARIGRRKLRPLASPVNSLRLVKDESEVTAIRKAVRIAQKSFRQLLSDGASAIIGRSEADLAGELEYLMRRNGAEGASFETIVAAGANSALPHHKPGGRRIRANQAVLFDWGAVTDGYCSDLTRVVFTGTIPPLIRNIYNVVLGAQKQAIAAIRSGLELRAVDAAARDFIAAAGYGDSFGHGLGHGIGLEIHEGPTVSARSEGQLRVGNVITVEPGIYLPGVGGVRLEDDVLVTRSGPVVLSSLPKGLSPAVLR